MTLKQDTYQISNEEASEIRRQAGEFLRSRYFYAAKDQFEKLLSYDPNDKEAHIGILLCENKADDIESLIKYYQDLYSVEETELLLACDKEEEHIEEMCEKFCLPGYLEKKEIGKVYDFDLSYRSSVFCRRKQKDEILKTIDKDVHLLWLKEKAEKEIGEILSAYDLRLKEAEEKDNENVQRIRNEYQRFLFQNYAKVKELNSEAKQRKEEEYKKLIREFEKGSDPDVLRDVSFRFEGFKDYKDAKRYASLANEKIDQLKKQEENRKLEKTIEDLTTEARAALVTGKYDMSYELFSKVLSADPENEEACLGILMSQTGTTDTEELFAYYGDLYNEGKTEVLEACEEDGNHIDEMAEKYCFPGYLEKEAIRQKYEYDRTYISCLNSRIDEEARFKEEVEANPIFMRLKRKGSKRIRDRIEELYDLYASRTAEARKEDNEKIERIRNDYQRFLFKTYASVKKLHKDASEKKENRYRNLIRSFETAQTESELERLVERFEEFADYKEARNYVSLCLSKIKEFRDKEKKESISQDIETALIAGRAYLNSGNTDLADRSFGKVLSMDENNAQAYLGILMIETETRNAEELIDYYVSQFSEDEVRTLEGCKEDRKHIEEAVKKYEVPGYFEKEEIENYYVFDRSYGSLTASRVLQKEQFNDEVRMNPLLSKIADSKDPQIVSLFERIRDVFDERISSSRQEDEKQSASIRHIYEIYLTESDKTVARISQERQKEKDAESETVYRRNIEQFNKALDEQELEELSARFDKDYKDGERYIKECRDRILSLRRNKEKNKLDALLKEGTELLKCRLFDDAKGRFEEYLKIDPENEDVTLKLLMAEKKVTDDEELFAHYKDLYFYDIPETKQAVEEDKEHIDEIVQKCYVPDVLEKQQIRDRYRFDREYQSYVNVRTVQKRQIEDEMRLDPLLAKLYKDGSDRIKASLDSVLETYEERLAEAMDQDETAVASIRKEYKAFLRSTDREVRSLYNDLIKERNKKAKSLEKQRKEDERRLREEAEKERIAKEAALNKEREEERRRLAAEEELKKREASEKEAAEKEKKERRREEKRQSLSEEERKRKLQEQRALENKERLEKQAVARREKERLKEERRQKAKESFAKVFGKKQKEVSDGKKTSFKIDPVLAMAVLSLIVLAFVLYIYVIVPGNKYRNALDLAGQGRYDEAAAIFDELGGYKDSEYQSQLTMYMKADSLYKDGDPVASANVFSKLRFDDSQDRVKQIKEEMIRRAESGSSILFGEYEQDGNTGNGKELIEWIVLQKDDGKLFVISKLGLDAREFNLQDGECYWETSSLRSWLNGRFPDNSFSGEDPSDVLRTTMTNYRYPEYEEGEDISELVMEEYESDDRIFLLDSAELAAYFPDEEDRRCDASEFAIENGVAAAADNSCSWWLRSPGNGRDRSEYVWNQYGTVSSAPQQIVLAIRPAMWIKTE